MTFLRARMCFVSLSVALISASELLQEVRSWRIEDHEMGTPEQKMMKPDMLRIVSGLIIIVLKGFGFEASCGPQFPSLYVNSSCVS